MIEKEVSSSQIGNGNTVSVNVGKNTDTLLFLEQFGNSNKVIIQIEDGRQSKLLELQSSGTGQDCFINTCILHIFHIASTYYNTYVYTIMYAISRCQYHVFFSIDIEGKHI